MKRKKQGFKAFCAATVLLVSVSGCATLSSPIRAVDNAIVSAKVSSETYGGGMWLLQPILMPLNFVLSWTGELGIGLWRDTVGWFTPGDNVGDVWVEGFYRYMMELEAHPTVVENPKSGHFERGDRLYWRRGAPEPLEAEETEEADE